MSFFNVHFFALSHSDQEKIIFNHVQLCFSEKDFIHKTHQNFDYFQLYNATTLTDIGGPNLPTKIIHIPIPDKTQNITIKNITLQKRMVEGKYNIPPVQPPHQLSRINITYVSPDQEIYNSNNAFPTEIIVLKGIVNRLNHSYARIQINPLQYIPSEGNLILNHNISFYINCIEDSQLKTQFSSLDEESNQNNLADDEIDYVIITRDHWTDDFKPLTQWKTRKGIPAKIINTTWIYDQSGYSGSNQQKIRSFIIDAYTIWGTKFFLLGGDVEIIPTHSKIFNVASKTFTVPSDTYYADYNDDYYCEVHVGRAPVKEEETDKIDTFIQKIINYEKNPPLINYTNLFLGCGFDLKQKDSAEGEELKESIKTFYLPNHWTYLREYDSENGSHKDDVISLLNQGCHLVNHADHANKNHLGLGLINHGDDLSGSEVFSLTNAEKQSILYSIGCDSAAFDVGECIGEAFIHNDDGGCVAYIGNTRDGWYIPNNPDSYSLRFDRYFFKSLFQEKKDKLGECFSDHKNDAYLSLPMNDTTKMIFYELVLLGDPELPIWTENPKHISTVHYPEQISSEQQNVSITVLSNQSFLSDARVCIQKKAEIYQREYTNELGRVSFNINPHSTGIINITVTKTNYIPYQCTMLVNNPPNIPVAELPENNSEDISVSTSLFWFGNDPDADAVKYDVYLGTNTTPSLLAENLEDNIFNPINLEFNTTYYWKIVVTDIYNKSCIGPLWRFTTEPEPLPPLANFTFDPFRPVLNDTILFTDTSTDEDGYILYWHWEFDDGNESNLQNPLHRFQRQKPYNVTLSIVDNRGKSDSITKNIVFNTPPVPFFSHTAVNVSTQDQIQFFDCSTDADGEIVNWSWNLFDNTMYYTKNMSFQFDDNGNYTVILTVKDNDHATATYSENIIIFNEPPHANFSYHPTNPNDINTVFFNDSSFDYDGNILCWNWEFGDGNSSSNQNPHHQYIEDGNYCVNLTVYDDDGDNNTVQKMIQIKNIPPKVRFSYDPLNPVVNQAIIFTDSSLDSDGAIINWTWDFGDGNKSSKRHPIHSYNKSGTFMVTLNVTDNDHRVNRTFQEIYINVPPKANFHVTPEQRFTNTVLDFSDHSVDMDGMIVSWFWEFGDGNFSIMQNPSHQYADEGVFEVVLKIEDERGADDIMRKNICIYNSPPQINFSFSSDIAFLNQTILFTDNSVDSDGAIINWTWDFGDNTFRYGKQVMYIPTVFSDLAVKLTVTDDDNATTTKTKIIPVADEDQIWLTQNNTIINFINKTGIQLHVIANYSVLCQIISFTSHYFDSNWIGLSSIGPFHSIKVSNESAIKWPMDIKVYYTQNTLEFANSSERQLIGLYFFNNSKGKWELFPETGVNTSYEKYGFQGYVWAKVYHLTNISVFADTTVPCMVQGLKVTDTKDGGLELRWNPSTDNREIMYYRIYCDKKNTVNTTDNSTYFKYEGLKTNVSYAFRVSAVDQVGNEGNQSDSVIGIPTVKQSYDPPSDNSDTPLNPPHSFLNARAVVTPTQAQVFDSIFVNGSRSVADEKIVTYHWDFGDRSSVDNVTAYHRYNESGIYQITLTITDEHGNTDTNVTDVHIISLNHPPQNLSINGSSRNHQSDHVSFQLKAIDNDNDSIRFIIDWNDSTSTTSEYIAQGKTLNITHSWFEPGIYCISIIAEDEKNSFSKKMFKTVYIDVHIINDTFKGYLVDKNSDGVYDFFIQDDSGKNVSVSFLSEKRYIIQLNENGSYLYDMDSGSLDTYIDDGIENNADHISLGLCIMFIFMLSFFKLRLGKNKK